MSVLAVDVPPLRFPEPLREGVILTRPNRFIMDVDFGGGEVVRCHCPAVSRIGGLDLTGRPCLVSDSHNSKRKMPLTVEAYSLQQPHDAAKQWIGINQNASNRYVEHYLREGAFAAITGPVASVRREVPLGSSRLDFLVNDDLYLEVKTPLVQMQTEIPAYVPRLPEVPFSSTERAMRHLRELAASLANHERAVILYCLYYDNFGFRYYHGTTYEEVLATVDACRAAGVELWQADFEVTPEGVALKRYYELERW
ncbi:DNA/RNA nuclease SfsA [Adlercreutzia sp. R25]|uniref:DNA/RNA nuclease SfsA n=1 Tax=Adlercreutzia shanghongiae TaxID=3111773 RepID=A0ABU6IYJ7_9ACTN|nr:MULTISPECIES: DNA/RNA nuclease SfsA [unclassified Adlercreutzia]MEC4271841.1 DNA/RNA nuclease SfsA [Adlercreutzia sp. R25]MEC4294848.1 DNA/RNA nuclease SfsA [Adlercreutzia sp. R22]